MVVDIDYRKFSNRVCNWREAGFIGISFVVAVGIVGAILLGIYLGTGCPAGETQCKYEGTCISNSKFCDGTKDCEIGDDEWVCAPTKFYVSFRTNEPRFKNEYLEGLAPTDPGFIEKADQYNKRITDDFERSIFNASFLDAKVFRFRFVDGKGHEYNSTEDFSDGFLTVDSFVEFSGTKDLRNKQLTPESITKVVRSSPAGQLSAVGAVIDDRALVAVTTGVAVVLTAPNRTKESYDTDKDWEAKQCRQLRMYCQNFCNGPEDDPPGDYYQHGSSKGCPECMCAKFSGTFPLK